MLSENINAPQQPQPAHQFFGYNEQPAQPAPPEERRETANFRGNKEPRQQLVKNTYNTAQIANKGQSLGPMKASGKRKQKQTGPKAMS